MANVAILMSTAGAPEVFAGDSVSAAGALFVLIVAVVAWVALRSLIRSLRAHRAEAALALRFPDFALEALVNAAKIDGRVNTDERRAVARAMLELGGGAYDEARVETAFNQARLSKDELVAYLAAKSRSFSRDQKTAFLKALLSVFVADGKFDEVEHAALVDYTAAVGFDRQSAPEMLRGIASDFKRGNIT